MTNPVTRPDLIDRASIRRAVANMLGEGGAVDNGLAIAIRLIEDAAPAAEPVPPENLSGESLDWHRGYAEGYEAAYVAEPVPLTLDALRLADVLRDHLWLAAAPWPEGADALWPDRLAARLLRDPRLRAASSEGQDRPARDPESPAP